MRQVLFLVGLITSFLLVAQDQIDVSEGKVFKSSKYGAFERFIHADENGYYALRQKRAYTSIFLEHYDNSLNYVETNELSLKKGKTQLVFDFIEKLNNKLYLFSSLKDKKTAKKILFVQSIDINKSTPNGDFKQLTELSFNEEIQQKDYFLHTISDNQSILATYHSVLPTKTSNQQFHVTVINSQLETMWNKTIEFPLDTNLFQLDDIQVDSKGDLYCLGRYNLAVGREYYKVFKYTDEGNKVKTYNFKLSQHHLLNSKMKVSTNEIIMAGLCTEERLATGAYFIRFDQEKEDFIKETQNFFPTFFEKYLETEEVSASDEEVAGLKDYILDYLIMNDDGSFYLLAEQYEVDVEKRDRVSSNGTAMVYSSYNYYYKDIAVVHFSSKGKILWSDKVLKKQFTMNDGGFYSSYAICHDQNKLQIVFNDHVQNTSEERDGLPKFFTGLQESSALVSVEVNTRGITNRTSIFSGVNYSIMTRLKRSSSLQSQRLLLFGIVGKQNKISQLNFDN